MTLSGSRKGIRFSWRTLTMVPVGLAVMVQLPGPGAKGADADRGKQVLQGHLLPDFARTRLVGKLPDHAVLHLAIGLPPKTSSRMETELKEIYDPTSPKFHHFLTPAQFAEKFGASGTDYESLIAFARANGLAVGSRFPDRLLLGVTGSAAAVNKAFHLTLTTRLRSDGSVFYAPDREPSLDLDTKIFHISGLDNFVLLKPAGSGGSGPSGSLAGSDFRNAYLPGVTLLGNGQSVGLFEFDGFYQADIAAYIKLFPANFGKYSPAGHGGGVLGRLRRHGVSIGTAEGRLQPSVASSSWDSSGRNARFG
jgi:Pro-kumamolisin, activation domain